MRRALIAAVVALLGPTWLAAPARAEQRTSVSVLFAGDHADDPRLAAMLRTTSGLPVDFRVARLPNTPAGPERSFAELEENLARARQSYINASFAECSALLGDDNTIARLLAAHQRTLTARVLFWRVACRVGDGKAGLAAAAAEDLAVFGLRTPADVESATPDVEIVLARARRKVEGTTPRPLRVSASRSGLDVSVDGRERACVTPCTIDLFPGDHLITLSGDGVAPVSRLVRVDGDGTEVSLEPEAAKPELAAAQWTSRYAGVPDIDSAASLRLLSVAIRDRRIVLVHTEKMTKSVRVRGALLVDGRVAARAERRGEDPPRDASEAVIRDLLIQGEILEASRPLHRRPLFWVVLGVSAAVTAGVTAYFVADPEVRTVIRF